MHSIGRWLSRLIRVFSSPSHAGRSATVPLASQVLVCDTSSISFLSLDKPTITSAETHASLTKAAHHLVDLLEPVVFPTETVYGLGAVALDEVAVSRIFATKGRPSDNPLIVHVSSMVMLRTLLPPNYEPSEAYEVLMDHFWPGPLTLIFPRDASIIPCIVSANHPTVAVRMPSHPVARALISIANAPIAAPSANSSGKPSPTRVEHVLRDLGGKVGIILDGGPCGVGLESTVIDGLHEDGNIRVLRPGGVTVEEIERLLEQKMADGQRTPKVLVHRKDYTDDALEKAPTTPGMKYRHYSPSVPVMLLLTKSIPPAGYKPSPFDAFLSELNVASPSFRKIGILAPSDSPLASYTSTEAGIEWRFYSLGPTSEPSIAAQRLFDGLLTLENQGVDLILVEEVNEEMEGLAVMNRIRKAASETRWVSLP